MELKAYAKINLSLDVLYKRKDGYHEVRMIMQSVGLHDILDFNPRENGIRLFCSNPYVPCDSRNIIYKVLELIRQKYGVRQGMEVDINKQIPVAAGLAGGSTDGASAIIAANSIWGLNMSYDDMLDIASRAGADVSFCLKGGTALAEGIGDKLTPLAPMGHVHVVIAKTPVQVSTREIYQQLKIDEIVARPDTVRIIRALEEGNIKSVADNMVNVLETVTIKKYPVIGEIKRIMVEFGALGSLMSGSGPSVFGLFASPLEAERCYNRLRDYMKEVYIVDTANNV
jgi:4-diphosphocytidyl-2-C-methyl-D-erythritol kinase